MSYIDKDVQKFGCCNKLITRGAPGSSSDKYKDPAVLGLHKLTLINDTNYSDIDIVGVSVNGARANRLSFDKALVQLAVQSGAVIVKDNSSHTARSFNIGERELQEFLLSLGAVCISDNYLRSSWRLQ